MFIPRSLLAAGLALVLVSPWTAPEVQAAPADAKSFVAHIGEKAVRELTPKDISDAERVKRMRALLAEAFDVKAISKFVLGITGAGRPKISGPSSSSYTRRWSPTVTPGCSRNIPERRSRSSGKCRWPAAAASSMAASTA